MRKILIAGAAGFAMLAASVPASADGKFLFGNGVSLFGGKAPTVGQSLGITCPTTGVVTALASERRHAVVNGVASTVFCIGAVSAGAAVAGPPGALVGGVVAGVVSPLLAANQKRRLLSQ